MKAEQRPHTAHTRRGMRLPQLLCLATLAASSSSKGQAEGASRICQVVQPERLGDLGGTLAQEEGMRQSRSPLVRHGRHQVSLPTIHTEISIAYKVLEVYPQSRRVLLTCHAPQAPPPVTYFLFASQGIQVAKKVVQTQQPASFTLNVTLKSSPDLLTYSCEVASPSGPHESSAPLQLYWELWAKPVSQLQTNITLHSGGPGPRAEMSCWAPSGSPLITYRLVSKDGQVHMQQRPLHGQPANFSFPLPPALGWFQCQAENSVGVQSSALTLVPPGELPQGPALVLTGSLISIAAVASGMLGWTRL